ncbi:C-C chemokine receptor type 10 [Engraulis encrasicolus]|uniref:C-C chemokine receptor type 10 n=1 Tax=Engraulis encrasicolus TaxID=184585 RepID=UPI002FD20B8E
MTELNNLYYDYDYDYNSTAAFDPETPCFSDSKTGWHSFQVAFYILVLVVGLMGNSLVVATFGRYWRSRRRGLTDAFLLHLALSDLQLLLSLPLQIAEALHGWLFGGALCRLTRGLRSVNTYSGLLLLACISAERYTVVVRRSGTGSGSRRGKNGSSGGTRCQIGVGSGLCCCRRVTLQALAACSSVTLAAVALSFPDFLFSEVEDDGEDKVACGLNVWTADASQVKMALSGSMIAGFCGPFVIMATCYTAIGCVLASGGVPGAHHAGKQHSGGGGGWRRQRTLRLMVALVLLFLLFQLPYTLVLVLKLVLSVEQHSCSLLLWESVTCSLSYTRCCLNPLLYALVGVRFRSDVLRLLGDAGCCSAGSRLRLLLPSSLSLRLTSDPGDSSSAASPASTSSPPVTTTTTVTCTTQLSPRSPASPLVTTPTPRNADVTSCKPRVFVYPSVLPK